MSHQGSRIATTVHKAEKRGDWLQFIDLIRQTNPSKLLLSIAIIMSMTTTCVGLVVPLFTKNLVDSFSLNSISPVQIITMVIAFIAQAIAAGSFDV